MSTSAHLCTVNCTAKERQHVHFGGYPNVYPVGIYTHFNEYDFNHKANNIQLIINQLNNSP